MPRPASNPATMCYPKSGCADRGSWSRNAELSSFSDSRWSSRFKPVNIHRDRGGRGRETQSCRHFWTCVWSARFKSVNSRRDRGLLVAKRRSVAIFGHVLRLRISKVSTVTGIGGGPGRETQNCRHSWSRVWSSRLKRVNSHGDRGVVVARRRAVVSLGLAFGLRVSNVSNSHRDRAVVAQSCRHFWICFGEEKKQRREEKREAIGEGERERRG